MRANLLGVQSLLQNGVDAVGKQTKMEFAISLTMVKSTPQKSLTTFWDSQKTSLQIYCIAIVSPKEPNIASTLILGVQLLTHSGAKFQVKFMQLWKKIAVSIASLEMNTIQLTTLLLEANSYRISMTTDLKANRLMIIIGVPSQTLDLVKSAAKQTHLESAGTILKVTSTPLGTSSTC